MGAEVRTVVATTLSNNYQAHFNGQIFRDIIYRRTWLSIESGWRSALVKKPGFHNLDQDIKTSGIIQVSTLQYSLCQNKFQYRALCLFDYKYLGIGPGIEKLKFLSLYYSKPQNCPISIKICLWSYFCIFRVPLEGLHLPVDLFLLPNLGMTSYLVKTASGTLQRTELKNTKKFVRRLHRRKERPLTWQRLV